MKTTVRSKSDARGLDERYADFVSYRSSLNLGGRGVFYGKRDMSSIFNKGIVR